MARFVQTEEGRVFEIADTSPMLRELVSGEWVKPTVPVFGGELMDATPLSETDVEKMIKTPRYVRTEDGRVFRLPAADLAELVDGAWVSPVAPVFGGELMDATPLSTAEIASIRAQEIEARAEESERALMKKLVQEYKAHSQVTMPTATTSNTGGLTPEEARQATQKIEAAEERAEARTDAMLDRLLAKKQSASQTTTGKTTTDSLHSNNTSSKKDSPITLDAIQRKRKNLETIRRNHKELEEAITRNARAFMQIDYAAAERDHAAGKVSDKEWDDFLTWYGNMRSYYRMFMDKSYKSEHREYEQLLEKQLRDMEHTYQNQNSLLNRLRRSLFGGV